MLAKIVSQWLLQSFAIAIVMEFNSKKWTCSSDFKEETSSLEAKNIFHILVLNRQMGNGLKCKYFMANA